VYLAWARILDRPAQRVSEPRPTPSPPRAARPKRLSVTEIEHWLRDPYTIYAKHVLRLAPLDEVDAAPGASERGTAIHNVLRDFSERYAHALPADAAAELIEMGKKHFAALEDFPEARAFWWPRFRRIAQWLAGWEAGRRAAFDLVAAEIKGTIDIPLAAGPFTLSGIADRIERDSGGGYAILDYKTGSVRSEKQVRTGLAPQLTLEAAMLKRGAFTGIAAGGSVTALAYVALKGGARAGEFMPIEFKDGTPDSQADRAFEKLEELVRRFDDDSVPYLSLVHPMWKARYGDYDHLARVKEWSSTGGPEDDTPGAAP
jgi:ATP-dependent helicase/nuclease subunit B